MVNFGTKKLNNMEEAWLTAVYESESTKPGNLYMQGTMLMLRIDTTFKRSRL